MTIDFSQARTNMIDSQIHTAGVVAPPVLEAFGSVPRESFLPEGLRDVAYIDEDVSIGEGRYLLEPISHAKMVQAVEPKADDVVLDIGVGTGYSSAILSSMVSTVLAVEDNEQQGAVAEKLWADLGACNVALVRAAPHQGVPEQAPYSLIMINGAVEEVPAHIFDQLDAGGRLVAVIRRAGETVGEATLFMKTDNGEISSRALFSSAVPALKGFEKETCFQF